MIRSWRGGAQGFFFVLVVPAADLVLVPYPTGVQPLAQTRRCERTERARRISLLALTR